MTAREQPGPVGSRKEMGNKASSNLHPPHVDENMEDAPLQDDHPSPDDVGALPATAHGKDSLAPDEQSRPIDETSMYGARPEENKKPKS